MSKPLNAQIAEALGWCVWEDTRIGCEGDWYQGRNPYSADAIPLMDYVRMLGDLQREATRVALIQEADTTGRVIKWPTIPIT